MLSLRRQRRTCRLSNRCWARCRTAIRRVILKTRRGQGTIRLPPRLVDEIARLLFRAKLLQHALGRGATVCRLCSAGIRRRAGSTGCAGQSSLRSDPAAASTIAGRDKQFCHSRNDAWLVPCAGNEHLVPAARIRSTRRVLRLRSRSAARIPSCRIRFRFRRAKGRTST